MNPDEWNPRFLLYSWSQGFLDPEDVIARDHAETNTGTLRFQEWTQAQLKAFRKAHPEAFHGDALGDQAAYDVWLREQHQRPTEAQQTALEL